MSSAYPSRLSSESGTSMDSSTTVPLFGQSAESIHHELLRDRSGEVSWQIDEGTLVRKEGGETLEFEPLAYFDFDLDSHILRLLPSKHVPHEPNLVFPGNGEWRRWTVRNQDIVMQTGDLYPSIVAGKIAIAPSVSSSPSSLHRVMDTLTRRMQGKTFLGSYLLDHIEITGEPDFDPDSDVSDESEQVVNIFDTHNEGDHTVLVKYIMRWDRTRASSGRTRSITKRSTDGEAANNRKWRT